jgi:hypothetical protein
MNYFFGIGSCLCGLLVFLLGIKAINDGEVSDWIGFAFFIMSFCSAITGVMAMK